MLSLPPPLRPAMYRILAPQEFLNRLRHGAQCSMRASNGMPSTSGSKFLEQIPGMLPLHPVMRILSACDRSQVFGLISGSRQLVPRPEALWCSMPRTYWCTHCRAHRCRCRRRCEGCGLLICPGCQPQCCLARDAEWGEHRFNVCVTCWSARHGRKWLACAKERPAAVDIFINSGF